MKIFFDRHVNTKKQRKFSTPLFARHRTTGDLYYLAEFGAPINVRTGKSGNPEDYTRGYASRLSSISDDDPIWEVLEGPFTITQTE